MKVGISTSSFASADPAPLERLKAAGVEVKPNPYGRRLTEAEAADFVSDLDGLIAGLEPLNRTVLTAGAELKAIARVGIGMDNVDHEAAKELSIAVSNTPDPPTAAVAELTITAMLALVRGFVPSQQSIREGGWVKAIQGSLSGATVAVVGLGRIGRRVVDLVRPFGSTILGVDPFLPEGAAAPEGVRLTSLTEALEVADVVTLHASGSDVLLGRGELECMKEGAILLNASRGTLVDEAALGDALDAGRLAAAWFDAFWEEPYTGSLAGRPTFYGTPHVATYTAACRRSMEMEAVENMLRSLGIGTDA